MCIRFVKLVGLIALIKIFNCVGNYGVNVKCGCFFKTVAMTLLSLSFKRDAIRGTEAQKHYHSHIEKCVEIKG